MTWAHLAQQKNTAIPRFLDAEWRCFFGAWSTGGVVLPLEQQQQAREPPDLATPKATHAGNFNQALLIGGLVD